MVSKFQKNGDKTWITDDFLFNKVVFKEKITSVEYILLAIHKVWLAINGFHST